MIERQNYLDIRAFLDYRERVMQNDPKTIRGNWIALKRLLFWADDVPLSSAPIIKNTFPAFLLTARNDGKERPLCAASLDKSCANTRLFFQWARVEIPDRYKNISESWIATIRPRRSKGMQTAYKKRDIWELIDAEKIAALKPETLTERRDQAAICFMYLSGMRVTAFVTLPINCVNVSRRRVEQLPEKGVQTKNHKAAITALLPIDSLLSVVRSWDDLIRKSLPDTFLWYPRLMRSLESFDLVVPGYKTPEGRREALIAGMKLLCDKAGVSYRSPHKLRHGHAVWGLKHSRTIEQMKAVSQNLMHKSLGITDGIYAILSADDVNSTIAGLGVTAEISPQIERSSDDLNAKMDEILKRLKEKE